MLRLSRRRAGFNDIGDFGADISSFAHSFLLVGPNFPPSFTTVVDLLHGQKH